MKVTKKTRLLAELPPIAFALSHQLPQPLRFANGAFRAGVCVGGVSQPVIKPALILLPPPAPWLLRPLSSRLVGRSRRDNSQRGDAVARAALAPFGGVPSVLLRRVHAPVRPTWQKSELPS